jgi:hypothetical protein
VSGGRPARSGGESARGVGRRAGRDRRGTGPSATTVPGGGLAVRPGRQDARPGGAGTRGAGRDGRRLALAGEEYAGRPAHPPRREPVRRVAGGGPGAVRGVGNGTDLGRVANG